MEAPRPTFRDRLSTLGTWSGRQAGRARVGAGVGWRKARAGAGVAWRKTKAAPWPKIGILASGVFGVLAVTFVLFLTFADWNAMRVPISWMAAAATGREIVIVGDLDVDPWSWTPEIRVADLRIGNPAHFRERGQFAVVNRAEANVRLLPLLVGRFEFVRLDLNGAHVSLYRSAEGVSNWSSSPDANRPFNMPAIREFSLNGGPPPRSRRARATTGVIQASSRSPAKARSTTAPSPSNSPARRS